MSGNLSSAERGSARLAERRRLRRRRALITLAVLFILLVAGIIYELNQSAVRISHITVYGADQSYADIATAAMQGKYLGLIPRDSTFFFPGSRIRADIISAHPNIAAVSLFRSGLTGLSLKVNERVAIARWCGAGRSGPIASSTPEGVGCYLFDASGFVYATTSDAQTVNTFVLYEPAPRGSEIIGSTLPNALKLPAVFDLARELGTFGSRVVSIVVRGDEVDDLLASGTRVTYVLGNEENAFTALTSARDSLNLADGSLEYIDLRFDGKVYLKKK